MLLRWIVGVGSVLTASMSAAQFGVNIDLDNFGGSPETGNGAPSPSFSAASFQNGFWTRVLATGTGQNPVVLSHLDGTPSTATVLTTGGVGSSGGFNNPAYSGDFRLLMADYMDVGLPVQFHFYGFQPGQYRIYTYGGNPAGLIIPMFVSVPSSSTPMQTITGPVPPMQFSPGLDYSLHELNLTGTSFEIDLTSNAPPYAQVTGFQIVPVPEPASFALVVLGVAILKAKRRRM